MPHRDEEIALLRQEVELLMGERELLLRLAGSAAALIASLDSKRLPVGAVDNNGRKSAYPGYPTP